MRLSQAFDTLYKGKVLFASLLAAIRSRKPSNLRFLRGAHRPERRNLPREPPLPPMIEGVYLTNRWRWCREARFLARQARMLVIGKCVRVPSLDESRCGDKRHGVVLLGRFTFVIMTHVRRRGSSRGGLTMDRTHEPVVVVRNVESLTAICES